MRSLVDRFGSQPLSGGQAFQAHADECARPPFAQVMRDEAPFVMRIARRLGAAPHELDDIAQEVFLVLHRRYAEWGPEVAIRSLLFGIVRRAVSNQRRKAHSRREVDAQQIPELAHNGPDPLRALEQGKARALLDEALATLDDDKRAVFVLFELEGIPMVEVATMLACSVKTAYSRLYAARESVRRSVLRAHATGRMR